MTSALNSRLYYSTVMHHRFKPKAHRFTYQVGSFLLDLDELEHMDQHLTGFSYNRAGLFSVYDKDYVTTEGHCLKQHAQHLLFEQGCEKAHRIELLCMPRNLGYGFHEDGLQSGLAVAEALGAPKRPWSVAEESGRIHWPGHSSTRATDDNEVDQVTSGQPVQPLS